MVSSVQAQKLVDQEVSGEELFDLAREDLERYGIPGGPAIKLSKAIQALKQEPGTSDHFLYRVSDFCYISLQLISMLTNCGLRCAIRR